MTFAAIIQNTQQHPKIADNYKFAELLLSPYTLSPIYIFRQRRRPSSGPLRGVVESPPASCKTTKRRTNTQAHLLCVIDKKQQLTHTFNQKKIILGFGFCSSRLHF
jgi:hypothetical protein